MSHRFDIRALVCPRCGAAPGTPCVNVTRSYLRGRALRHPHRERRLKVKGRAA
jgi:hypothetical protein